MNKYLQYAIISSSLALGAMGLENKVYSDETTTNVSQNSSHPYREGLKEVIKITAGLGLAALIVYNKLSKNKE